MTLDRDLEQLNIEMRSQLEVYRSSSPDEQTHFEFGFFAGAFAALRLREGHSELARATQVRMTEAEKRVLHDGEANFERD